MVFKWMRANVCLREERRCYIWQQGETSVCQLHGQKCVWVCVKALWMVPEVLSSNILISQSWRRRKPALICLSGFQPYHRKLPTHTEPRERERERNMTIGSVSLSDTQTFRPVLITDIQRGLKRVSVLSPALSYGLNNALHTHGHADSH